MCKRLGAKNKQEYKVKIVSDASDTPQPQATQSKATRLFVVAPCARQRHAMQRCLVAERPQATRVEEIGHVSNLVF